MNELLQKLLANPASLLLGGGVITAIVAGWKQVKGFLDQLLSIAVVRAHYHGPAAFYLGETLARDWYLVPSQKLNFWSERLPTRDYKEAVVLWKIFGGGGLFVKGRRFLFVTNMAGHELEVWTIRGVVNLQDLGVGAAKHGTSELASMDRKDRRFSKTVVIGEQKTMGGFQPFGPGQNDRGARKSVARSNDTHETAAPAVSDAPGGYVQIWQKAKPPVSMTKAELEIPKSHGLDGFFWDPPVLSEVSDMERWLQMQAWFQERHLPWTRGWLLWGPPGTGKSSLAEVTAKHLGIPLFIFKLGTLSDQELTEWWNVLVTPCLCLFEDFDTVFDGRKPLTEHKSLTFDCILNLLSGPQQRDGVFLVVTTNHVEKIDPALGLPRSSSDRGESTRPGRIDRVIHIGAASEGQRRYVVNKILRDFDGETRDRMVANLEDGCTVAQAQDRCIQFIMDALRTGVYPVGKNPLLERGGIEIN